MSRWSRLVPVFAVALVLAACSQDSATPLGPTEPRLDNGVLIGGNEQGDGSGSGSGGSTTGGTSVQGDTASRGVLIGGN